MAALQTSDISQKEPLHRDQVVNDEGAYVWKVDESVLLQRLVFMRVCNAKTSEEQDTQGIVATLETILEAIGPRRVMEQLIGWWSQKRTPKSANVVLVLARCTQELDTRTLTENFLAICKSALHLLKFFELRKKLGHKNPSRKLKKVVQEWFNNQDPQQLAHAAIRYEKRGGWNLTDVLRLHHVKPGGSSEASGAMKYIARSRELEEAYAANPNVPQDEFLQNQLEYAQAAKAARKGSDCNVVEHLIEEHKLDWELINTDLLRQPKIWISLLQHMSTTALIRNLGRMTKLGIVETHSEKMAQKLDLAELTAGNVHPYQVLKALLAYIRACPGKGTNFLLSSSVDNNKQYEPKTQIVQALSNAWQELLVRHVNVRNTGKSLCIAVENSARMDDVKVYGRSFLSPRKIAMALAWSLHKCEPRSRMYLFGATKEDSRELKILSTTTLQDFVAIGDDRPHSQAADCSLPMTWAMTNNIPVDGFVLFTSNQGAAADSLHPAKAFTQYRDKLGHDQQGHVQKFISCAMTYNPYSIVEPGDEAMRDVVGLDADCISEIMEFIYTNTSSSNM